MPVTLRLISPVTSGDSLLQLVNPKRRRKMVERWMSFCMTPERYHVLDGEIEGIKNAVSREGRVF